MQYKRIESEIDRLLAGNGLNKYERKLFKKVKERLSEGNRKFKAEHMAKIKEINENNQRFGKIYMKDCEISRLKSRLNRYKRFFQFWFAYSILLNFALLLEWIIK